MVHRCTWDVSRRRYDHVMRVLAALWRHFHACVPSCWRNMWNSTFTHGKSPRPRTSCCGLCGRSDYVLYLQTVVRCVVDETDFSSVVTTTFTRINVFNINTIKMWFISLFYLLKRGDTRRNPIPLQFRSNNNNSNCHHDPCEDLAASLDACHPIFFFFEYLHRFEQKKTGISFFFFM